MRSPAAVAALLRALSRSPVEPRHTLLLASTPMGARELAALVAEVHPRAAHEVRVLTPAGFVAWAAALAPAASAVPTRPLGASASRAALRSVLWQLPLGAFRPPNAPDKHFEPIARLFADLAGGGVLAAAYAAHARDVGDATHAQLAEAYGAWLDAQVKGAGSCAQDWPGALLALLTLLAGPNGGALRAAAWRDVHSVLVSDAGALNIGPARLLLGLFGPAAASSATPSVASAVLEGHAPQPAPQTPPPPPHGSVQLFLDVPAPSSYDGSSREGHSCLTTLARRLIQDALPSSTTPSMATSSTSSTGLPWSLFQVDHAASVAASLPCAAASTLLRGIEGPSESSSAATARRTRARKLLAASAAVPPNSPQEESGEKIPGLSGSILADAEGGSLASRVGIRYIQSLRQPPVGVHLSTSTLSEPPPLGFVECVGIGADADARRSVAAIVRALAEADCTLPVGKRGVPLTIAVLTKSNAEAGEIAANLFVELGHDSTSQRRRRVNAPAVRLFADARAPLARVPEVRWLLAALGTLAAPAESSHWYTLATSPLYGLPVHTVGAWVRAANNDASKGGVLAQLVAAVASATPSKPTTLASPPPVAEAGQALEEPVSDSSNSLSTSSTPSSDDDITTSPSFLVGLEGSGGGIAGGGSPWPSPHAHTRTSPSSSFRGTSSHAPLSAHPAVIAAAVDLVGDLRHAFKEYIRTHSAASTLRVLLHRTGLEAVLLHPRSAEEHDAAAAVARLMQLCIHLERPASAAQRRKLKEEGASPMGLPFVFDALLALVGDGEQQLSYYAIGTGGGGEGGSHGLLRVDGGDVEGDSIMAGDAGDESLVIGGSRLLEAPLHVGDGDTTSPSPHIAGAFQPTAADAVAVQTHAQIIAALRSERGATTPAEAAAAAALDAALQPSTNPPPEGGSIIPLHALAPSAANSTIIVTTLRKGLEHMYDVVFLPSFSTSAYPGPYSEPTVPFPSPLFEAYGASAPFPTSRAEHTSEIRRQVASAVTRARLGVVFTCPASTPGYPTSSRFLRSALLDDLFGDAPRNDAPVAALPVSPAAAAVEMDGDAAQGGGGGGDNEVDATEAAPTPSPPSPPPLPPPPSPLPLTLPRLSHSAVTDFEWCPARYKYGRVDSVPSPHSVHLRYGVAMHASIAYCGEALGSVLLRAALSNGLVLPRGIPGVDVAAATLSHLCDGGEGADRARSAALAALPTPEALARDMLHQYRSAWLVEDKRSWDAGAAVAAAAEESQDASAATAAVVVIPAEGTIAAAPAVVGMDAGASAYAEGVAGGGVGADSAVEASASSPTEAASTSLDDDLSYQAQAVSRYGFPPAQIAALDEAACAATARAASAEIGAVMAWLKDPSQSPSPPSMPALIEKRFDVMVSHKGGGRHPGASASGGPVRVTGVIDRVDVAVVRKAPSTSAATTSTPGAAPLTASSFELIVREFKSSVQWKKKLGGGGESPLKTLMRSSMQPDLYALALHALGQEEGWAAPLTRMRASNGSGSGSVGGDDDGGSSPAAALPLPRVRVDLESIEAGTFESKTVTARDKDNAAKRVVEAAVSIASARFEPTPAEHKCTWCPFTSMCPVSYGKGASVSATRVRRARKEEGF